MSWNYAELESSNQTNTSPKYSYVVNKPIEIYVFIDPLCPECWSLEPNLKKLSIEFGRFFTIYPIVGGYLNPLTKDKFDQPKKLKDIWEKTAKRTGMSCDGDLWIENPINSPKAAFLAIKAAELQGKRAGRVFLRKIQESVFLYKQDVSKEQVLLQCAQDAGLDLNEFKNDLHSASAKKALQCDLKLTKEMEVDYTPTIVFFNQNTEDQGIKISGLYPYDIYVRVLSEMLQSNPIPSEQPPLESFIADYDVVGSKEIAVVYNWSLNKAEREMKKLQLRQEVEKIPAKYGTFWKRLD
ncbi:Predicted dithiol-disulfide isomerase, DsbA family [Oceanobacillus limi]|uniref:ClpXP adapter protein SpxH n=1 Tax=Oceanobacillus limi TaxID=930131 RepID=A0A1I0C8H6_9BACI|nr:ClpXP adapter SpxH family protein [Oceanobacillus limi]SET15699.1 Predicted dithiol-disulfide isomerase, DsbA family [Oceanobacillus limi]